MLQIDVKNSSSFQLKKARKFVKLKFTFDLTNFSFKKIFTENRQFKAVLFTFSDDGFDLTNFSFKKKLQKNRQFEAALSN